MAGAVVGRVDFRREENRLHFSTSYSFTNERALHYSYSTGIPLNVPLHPPPVLFALEQFHAVAGLSSHEPVLMVPDEHELQGQIYGVGEPLPSQL